MEIKEHRLLVFIELYKELNGVTLNRQEAYEKASLLLNYVLLCLKPLAKVVEKDIIDKRNERD